MSGGRSILPKAATMGAAPVDPPRNERDAAKLRRKAYEAYEKSEQNRRGLRAPRPGRRQVEGTDAQLKSRADQRVRTWVFAQRNTDPKDQSPFWLALPAYARNLSPSLARKPGQPTPSHGADRVPSERHTHASLSPPINLHAEPTVAAAKSWDPIKALLDLDSDTALQVIQPLFEGLLNRQAAIRGFELAPHQEPLALGSYHFSYIYKDHYVAPSFRGSPENWAFLSVRATTRPTTLIGMAGEYDTFPVNGEARGCFIPKSADGKDSAFRWIFVTCPPARDRLGAKYETMLRETQSLSTSDEIIIGGIFELQSIHSPAREVLPVIVWTTRDTHIFEQRSSPFDSLSLHPRPRFTFGPALPHADLPPSPFEPAHKPNTWHSVLKITRESYQRYKLHRLRVIQSSNIGTLGHY